MLSAHRIRLRQQRILHWLNGDQEESSIQLPEDASRCNGLLDLPISCSMHCSDGSSDQSTDVNRNIWRTYGCSKAYATPYIKFDTRIPASRHSQSSQRRSSNSRRTRATTRASATRLERLRSVDSLLVRQPLANRPTASSLVP